ncbi:MAG: class I SAM-dependent methyltransferase [bacterium]|nr:class I SAM-dependent methyltransferase [bacterium]
MITDKNRSFYNKFWKNYSIPDPKTWPHWQIIGKFKNKTCLEIGPGTRPKIPIVNNYFLDISSEAIKKLQVLGAKASVSDLKTKFPFPQNNFDLVCGFEVLEHLCNDTFILKEFERILKPGGYCFVSFPLHQHLFTSYDTFAGHIKRYEPKNIDTLFRKSGFRIFQYATISVLWPNNFNSGIAVFLTKQFPAFFSKLQEFFDSRPNSVMRKPIKWKKWNKESWKNLMSDNTGIFLAKKL